VLDHPGVSCAISGFSKPSDVAENLATEALAPLTDDNRRELTSKAQQLDRLGKQFCTACKYCMPCPENINISHIFELVNRSRLLGLGDWARAAYRKLAEDRRADKCSRCGNCIEKCTNKLDIPGEMEKAHSILS